MKPIIVKSKLVPKRTCVNLFGTFWTQDKSWIDKYVVNHERIHTRQQLELLFIPFYILYILEWLFRLVQYRKHHEAYMNISFEREAYANGHNLGYLPKRKVFAWVNYLRKKS